MSGQQEVRQVLAELVVAPERVADIPRDELPELAGEAAALQARILARIAAREEPAAALRHDPGPDRFLTAKEAAEILGVPTKWMYDHWEDLPFARKLRPRTLRFSESGLRRWLETRPRGASH